MGLGATRSLIIRGLKLRVKTGYSSKCRQVGQAFKGASGEGRQGIGEGKETIGRLRRLETWENLRT